VSEDVKKSRIWLVGAVFCLILGIFALIGKNYLQNNTEVVVDTDLSTGGRNRCITADEDKDVVFVGTHDGILKAFNSGEELWSAEPVSGAYCKLVLNDQKDKLYAANEGQQIYIYDAATGNLLQQISVGRNVVGLAVNASETKIAVATNTGKNKSNLLVYSSSGEELYNTQFTSTVFRAIEYNANDDILVANKRGEVTRMSEDGEKLEMYKANYDIIQMQMNEGLCWALSMDGTYHALDSDLNCVRKGRISNTINANLSALGVDKNGEYVLVGSEQGYIFVNNGQDVPVYTADFKDNISGTFTGSDSIYFVSLGNFVKEIYTERLENASLIKTA